MSELESVYYDPSLPGSYGGIEALQRVIKTGKVKDWLMGQDTYTLHKQARKQFPRRQVFVPAINHLWQLDLIDVISIARYNDGYKFILTVIDCLSKYAYAVAIKSKNSQNVTDAFASIINHNYNNNRPVYVQTDKGREFLNSTFQKFLAENGISHYTTESEAKASVVERFNRTLKSKMWRYFTKNRTYRFIDVLDKLVDGYNKSYHRTIKMAPVKVNYSNQNKIIKSLYGKPSKMKYEKKKNKLKVGDKVRISHLKKVFDKSYKENWTTEIFFVSDILPTRPPTYSLKDYEGESIKGNFYEQELQKVIKTDDTFIIEKVLKSVKKNGKTRYLVRWLGYPPKFDSWVDDLLLDGQQQQIENA